jgi:bifunctional DNA-binding transcriptional regulator/antitoxin component of YhaV-PrlF toxin-antitoxin module
MAGMVKTHISSKGQTTIPAKFRARWKSTEVVWEDLPDGSAQVRPVPDIMSLLGSARTRHARDLGEKNKARLGWAEGSERGRAKR